MPAPARAAQRRGRRPGTQARRAAWARQGEQFLEAHAGSRPLVKKHARCKRLWRILASPRRLLRGVLGCDSPSAARGCIVVGRPVRYINRWGKETKKTATAKMADRDPSREGGGQARHVDAPGGGMPWRLMYDPARAAQRRGGGQVHKRGAVLQTRQGKDTPKDHALSRPRSPAPTKTWRGPLDTPRPNSEHSANHSTTYAPSASPPALSGSARVTCRAHVGAPEAPTPL
jgi:hypothetical protein